MTRFIPCTTPFSTAAIILPTIPTPAICRQMGSTKMLKKVGEESAEVIIAAKNGRNAETIGEIADLTYHLLVLMAEQGIRPEDIGSLLDERHGKSGNLKKMKTVDKNS